MTKSKQSNTTESERLLEAVKFIFAQADERGHGRSVELHSVRLAEDGKWVSILCESSEDREQTFSAGFNLSHRIDPDAFDPEPIAFMITSYIEIEHGLRPG